MDVKLLQVINQILQNNGKESLNEINSTMSLRGDVGLNSLDLAELTVRIESEFGVDIFADGLIDSVADVLKKLNAKI